MAKRRGQAAKVVLKVQTLGLIPALNVSKSLGKFRPGILIQHFVRQRGQIHAWPHLGRGRSSLGLCFAPPVKLDVAA